MKPFEHAVYSVIAVTLAIITPLHGMQDNNIIVITTTNNNLNTTIKDKNIEQSPNLRALVNQQTIKLLHITYDQWENYIAPWLEALTKDAAANKTTYGQLKTYFVSRLQQAKKENTQQGFYARAKKYIRSLLRSNLYLEKFLSEKITTMHGKDLISLCDNALNDKIEIVQYIHVKIKGKDNSEASISFPYEIISQSETIKAAIAQKGIAEPIELHNITTQQLLLIKHALTMLKKNPVARVSELIKDNDNIEILKAFVSATNTLKIKPLSEKFADFTTYSEEIQKEIAQSILKPHYHNYKFLKTLAPSNFAAGSANSVFFSPDGMYLAAALTDATVTIWKLLNEKFIQHQTLKGHTNTVESVCFSPDGTYLASGSHDNTIKIWKLLNEKFIEHQTLTGHTHAVNSVCFSPDGTYLASGSDDETIKIWKLLNEEFTKNQTLMGHTSGVRSVCFSPDSTYIASGSDDETVIIWKLLNEKFIEHQTLTSHTSGVRSVCFSPDGTYLASGSNDTTIIVWKLLNEKFTEHQTLKGHTDTVESVCFNPDSTYLTSGSDDTTVTIWKLLNEKFIEHQKLKDSAGYVTAVCFSHDGKYLLASGSAKQTIIIWEHDLPQLNNKSKDANIVEQAVLIEHIMRTGTYLIDNNSKQAIIWLALPEETRRSLSGMVTCLDKQKILEDESTKQPLTINTLEDKSKIALFKYLKNLQHNYPEKFMSFVNAFDSKPLLNKSIDFLAQCSIDTIKKIKLPHPIQARIAQNMLQHYRRQYALYNTIQSESSESYAGPLFLMLSFSPDGRYLAAALTDATVTIWKLLDGNFIEQQTLKGHARDVNSVCFSSDGTYLASGSHDNTIKIWKLHNEKFIEHQTLTGHTHAVNSACFSPDGTYLASGSDDKTVKIWKLLNEKFTENQTLMGHTSGVRSVCFSPDSTYIASGSDDETVIIWKLLDGNFIEHQILKGHSWNVTSVSFSPDGTYLASGSCDTTVIIWIFKAGQFVESQTIKDHSINSTQACFSHDGKYLASTYKDNVIKIWELEKGKFVEEQTIRGHNDEITSLCFSPDDRYIASASDDRTTKIWKLSAPLLNQTSTEANVLEQAWLITQIARTIPTQTYIIEKSSTEEAVWNELPEATREFFSNRTKLLSDKNFSLKPSDSEESVSVLYENIKQSRHLAGLVAQTRKSSITLTAITTDQLKNYIIPWLQAANGGDEKLKNFVDQKINTMDGKSLINLYENALTDTLEITQCIHFKLRGGNNDEEPILFPFEIINQSEPIKAAVEKNGISKPIEVSSTTTNQLSNIKRVLTTLKNKPESIQYELLKRMDLTGLADFINGVNQLEIQPLLAAAIDLFGRKLGDSSLSTVRAITLPKEIQEKIVNGIQSIRGCTMLNKESETVSLLQQACLMMNIIYTTRYKIVKNSAEEKIWNELPETTRENFSLRVDIVDIKKKRRY